MAITIARSNEITVTEEDVQIARAWGLSQGVKIVRRTPNKVILDWIDAGKPFVEPQPKATASSTDPNSIVATITATNVDAKGNLSDDTFEIPITLGDVREVRGEGAKGRPHRDDYTKVGEAKMSDSTVPLSIVTSKGATFVPEASEDGKRTWSTKSRKAEIAEERIANLEAELKAREEQLAEMEAKLSAKVTPNAKTPRRSVAKPKAETASK